MGGVALVWMEMRDGCSRVTTPKSSHGPTWKDCGTLSGWNHLKMCSGKKKAYNHGESSHRQARLNRVSAAPESLKVLGTHIQCIVWECVRAAAVAKLAGAQYFPILTVASATPQLQPEGSGAQHARRIPAGSCAVIQGEGTARPFRSRCVLRARAASMGGGRASLHTTRRHSPHQRRP